MTADVNTRVPGTAQDPIPPGLVGMIAQFIFDAAPYPNRKVALAGAFALMAGICGRAFNVNGAGLNLYLMLLAATGVGKEAANAGMSKLMSALSKTVPASSKFVGPSYFASAQALTKHMAEALSTVCVVGEAGLKLEAMLSPRASPADRQMGAGLLDLYSKSGSGNVFQSMVYSDRDKNIAAIHAPALSLLFEGTPATVLPSFNESSLRSGLMPRILTFSAGSHRGEFNDWAGTIEPSADLLDRLGNLCAVALTHNSHNNVQSVRFDAGGDEVFRSFRSRTDRTINLSTEEIERHLYSRATLTGLKLAALVAVGINCHDPVIDGETATNAFHLVEAELQAVLSMFANGDVGIEAGNQTKQQRELIRVLADYIERDWAYCSKYHGTEEMHRVGVISAAHISQRLSPLKAFAEDRQGARQAIKRTIEAVLETDVIQEMPVQQIGTMFGKRSRAFGIINPDAVRKGRRA